MDQSQSRTVRCAVGGLSGLALLLLLGWLILRESPPSPVQSAKFAPVPSSVSPRAPTLMPDETSPHEPATNQVAAPTVTNAAAFYQQAFALYDALTKEEKDLITGRTNDPSAAADLCGKIQPICDLMRQAAAVSNCDWGVERPITFGTRFPYLLPCRNLARAATWSVGHCRTDDASAAVEDLVATSRLGQNVSRPTIVLACLMDQAIQDLVAHSVADNASLLASTDDSELIDLLTNAHYDDALILGFKQTADEVTRLADDLAAMSPEEAQGLAQGLLKDSSAYVSGSQIQQIQSMGQAQAAADIRQAAELQLEYAQALVMRDAEYRAWMASLHEDENANPFVGVFVTPLERTVDQTQYATVISAMAAAGLAVMQDGPDALDSYPDPATGQPFTYTQTEDGFVLESGFPLEGKSIEGKSLPSENKTVKLLFK